LFKIFQISVDYIWCEIISADILRVVKLSDTRDYCQDIFNQWFYCFNCRCETSSSNWKLL